MSPQSVLGCFSWLALGQEEMAAGDKPVPGLQPSPSSYNIQTILQLPRGREGWQWYEAGAREFSWLLSSQWEPVFKAAVMSSGRFSAREHYLWGYKKTSCLKTTLELNIKYSNSINTTEKCTAESGHLPSRKAKWSLECLRLVNSDPPLKTLSRFICSLSTLYIHYATLANERAKRLWLDPYLYLLGPTLPFSQRSQHTLAVPGRTVSGMLFFWRSLAPLASALPGGQLPTAPWRGGAGGGGHGNVDLSFLYFLPGLSR